MLASLLYSLLRALLDVLATNRGDQAQLQAEVLALRRQVQVLERQIKPVRWTPGDRMLNGGATRSPPQIGMGGTAREERLPIHARSRRRSWDPALAKQVSDGRDRHAVADFEKFSVDPDTPPLWVVLHHPQDQCEKPKRGQS